MIKVFFKNSWGEDPRALLRRYSKQTPRCEGKWKNIVGVSNINDADYCIILGGPHTRCGFNPDKTVYVKREPRFIEREVGKFKHSILWKDSHCGITWWLNKTYDELKELKYPHKEKLASCVVSSKHNHRRALVQKIFEHKTTNIDIFGRWDQPQRLGKSYRGTLSYDGNCKFLGLYPYKWSIVLENSQESNYWTEKLADAYLSWCIPIYWGCPNVSDYFSTDSYNTIEITDNTPYETLKQITEKPITPTQIEALRRARALILDTYNIWEIIRKKIEEINKK